MDQAPELTDDVRTLVGNPRKAILSMTGPIAISNLIQCANSFIDAVWVAGLGTAALAANGVIFPFFYVMLAIGTGIGTGATQAIARRIGASDYENTHRVASQAVYMSMLAGAVLAVVLTLSAEPLLMSAGAGEYIEECMDYALPFFICAPVAISTGIFTALLRAEGAAKRSMIMNVAGAVVNIILDPIFIYGFGWGVAGAAWATVIAMGTSSLIAMYWYFGKRDTFVRIPLRNFRFDRAIDRDILSVGIPASMEMALMSLSCLLMNVIIYSVDPVDGLAVYSTGWRALNLLMIPAMALGYALIPVTAASYGAKRYDKVRESLRFSNRFGTAMMAVLAVVTYVAAPLIVAGFTYTEASKPLAPAMVEFIRISSTFLVFTSVAFAGYGFFQGLGMGVKSLMCTSLVNFLGIVVCYMLTSVGTLEALWWGFAAAQVVGSLITFAWATLLMRSLMREYPKVRQSPPPQGS